MSRHYWSTIVLPLDGSKLSEKPIPLVTELASRLAAPVFLVNVPEIVEPALAAYPDFEARLAGMLPASDLDAMRDAAREEAVAYLNGHAVALRRHGITVECEVGEGRPAESILASVERHRDALLVMATHGRRGLSRWAFGSVADSLLQSVRRAMLLVPAAADHVTPVPKRILVPLDGSPAAETILPSVRAIARLFGSHVELGHVMPDFADLARVSVKPVMDLGRRYELWLRDYMAGVRTGLAAEHDIESSSLELSGGDVADALLAQAARDDVDLLAMTTGVHGEDATGSTSGVVSRILRHTRTPVLLRRTDASG